ncbi:MAG TPA: hypothetical protein VJ841_05015 [Candidatus Saccharimonadales bacterium]|nr:hypothetical protein [Candidatus Saccharimonadales bacterium]
MNEPPDRSVVIPGDFGITLHNPQQIEKRRCVRGNHDCLLCREILVDRSGIDTRFAGDVFPRNFMVQSHIKQATSGLQNLLLRLSTFRGVRTAPRWRLFRHCFLQLGRALIGQIKQ